MIYRANVVAALRRREPNGIRALSLDGLTLPERHIDFTQTELMVPVSIAYHQPITRAGVSDIFHDQASMIDEIFDVLQRAARRRALPATRQSAAPSPRSPGAHGLLDRVQFLF
ncbi:hypothetical protein [Mesorhizobium kowhaii]|nr:hypothetical protein [Mesorhizobium kowhaii]